MKVEVAVLGSPSLISLMVSVDVKQHSNQDHIREKRNLPKASKVRFTVRDKDQFCSRGNWGKMEMNSQLWLFLVERRVYVIQMPATCPFSFSQIVSDWAIRNTFLKQDNSDFPKAE